MKRPLLSGGAVAFILLFIFGSVAMAQPYTPNVQVSDKGIVDDAVIIVRATVAGPAWAVIHADADGQPGPVIGQASLTEGDNFTVTVPIDPVAATPLLHAMLHVDAGTVGVFEFPGPDEPIQIGDNIVMARFSALPPTIATEAAAPAVPAALPTTGGEPSTPFLVGVVATILLGLSVSVVFARRYHA
jgi:hypothetical protein